MCLEALLGAGGTAGGANRGEPTTRGGQPGRQDKEEGGEGLATPPEPAEAGSAGTDSFDSQPSSVELQEPRLRAGESPCQGRWRQVHQDLEGHPYEP